MSSAFHYIPWLSSPCSWWAAPSARLGAAAAHCLTSESHINAMLFLHQLSQPPHKNRKKKNKNQQHVPSRRVCYANDSVVSLTQEKQLLPLPLFLTGLKPSRIFAVTKEKSLSLSFEIIWEMWSPQAPVWTRANPSACNGHALEAAAAASRMKWKEAVAVYVGSRFKL